MNNVNADACIHCGLCTKNCAFLGKYGMDLQEFMKHPELAYSCFMCRKCTEVCPKNIEGEQIALSLRRGRVTAGTGADKDKDYKGVLWEKNGYKFANYKKADKKAVFMPGCNFPSFYPKTTKRVEEIMAKHGIGMLSECCGKPVYELGLTGDAMTNLKKMEERLKANGVEEIVLLCPNCYHFMKDKIDLKLVIIYDKLKELGEGNVVERKRFPLYYPCPDRASKEIFEKMKPFLSGEVCEPFDRVQCCGLGGCAAVKEPLLAQRMVDRVQGSGAGELYTYCASCISNFQRKGFKQAYHVLPLILEVEEEVPLGIRPFLNRAKKIL